MNTQSTNLGCAKYTKNTRPNRAVWTGPGSCGRGKLPMYKRNARDHFNCSPLLFSWPAPRNRCGQTERGATGVFASPMVSTINNIIVSGEAILSADNSGKPLGGRGFAPNPAGELTALPKTWAASPGGVWGTMSPHFWSLCLQRVQSMPNWGLALQWHNILCIIYD